MRWAALSFDLDDTLWPIAPVMERAEQQLDRWLAEHCPEAHAAWPIARMRGLRDQVWAEHPSLQHDFTTTRIMSLRRALNPFGYGEMHVEQAYEVFFAARNQVELFPEVRAALEYLARDHVLFAISNGNADLRRVGLADLFRFSLHAREHGVAKPDRSIFDAACARAGLAPAQVLHIGDHPEQDVVAAQSAGLDAVWLDRGLTVWPQSPPAARLRNLDELVDYIEHQDGGFRHEAIGSAIRK